MIAASLLLIAGAVALLVLGLWQSSSALLGASIAASLLAAVVLVVGTRRATARSGHGGSRGTERRRGEEDPRTTPPADRPGQAAGGEAEPGPATTATIPAQQGPTRDTTEIPDDAEADPPDEPAPQQVSAADAARVGRMLTEVLVVDGRPRYHLPGCVHLLGRDSEPLPVGEAVELGFTPCSLCEPDSALLADARRV